MASVCLYLFAPSDSNRPTFGQLVNWSIGQMVWLCRLLLFYKNQVDVKQLSPLIPLAY